MQDYVLMGRGKTRQVVESGFNISEALKPKIYNLEYDEMKGILITEFSEKFEFNFKIYDLDSEFINHALTMMPKINHNIGILFNGVKGTGKTITSKVIANNLIDAGVPVILVPANYPGLEDFMVKMSQIQSCVWFFDEFEKIFQSKSLENTGASLLPIMDGVLTGFKQYFLLTTNELRFNRNFLSRPGRIRWIRTYKSLSREVIVSYLKDNLNENRQKDLEALVDYIGSYTTLSIDLIKTICEELNLCDGPIEDVLKYINSDSAEYFYEIVCCDAYGGTFKYEDVKKAFHDFLNRSPKKAITDEDEYDDGRKPNPHRTMVTSDTPVRHLRVHDYFDDCVILEPLNKDNIIICRENNHYFYAYVLNPDARCLSNWGSAF